MSYFATTIDLGECTLTINWRAGVHEGDAPYFDSASISTEPEAFTGFELPEEGALILMFGPRRWRQIRNEAWAEQESPDRLATLMEPAQ